MVRWVPQAGVADVLHGHRNSTARRSRGRRLHALVEGLEAGPGFGTGHAAAEGGGVEVAKHAHNGAVGVLQGAGKADERAQGHGGLDEAAGGHLGFVDIGEEEVELLADGVSGLGAGGAAQQQDAKQQQTGSEVFHGVEKGVRKRK